MKIHAICIVKNEADIIVRCLTAASKWCDHIYVLDNGSTDNTWQLVQSLATELSEIVPWKSDETPFSDGLRASIYRHFRAASLAGDWWCALDADELYIDDPRVFIQKIPDRYDTIWTASFSFYFTDKDAEQYVKTPELYGDDVPVEDKIRFYVNHWSEPRFFRFRDSLSWSEGRSFPAFVYTEPAYPVRIWVKHFPYRSPRQIEQRLADRQEAISRGAFIHEAIKDWGSAVGAVRVNRGLLDRVGMEFATGRWEDRVVPASSLDFDAHDQRLVVNEWLMPALPAGSSTLRKAAARLRAARARAAAILGRDR
jgi:glycosyltransferase involved in cell wall biosynthesis